MTATADAQMIPVRALNQVTYCPRLYYLQYVDAVMPTNEHVEGGLFDHRRVDEPDLANKTRKEGDANRSRGVHLSSETLGISGVLDVIEEKDGESYPVETKHGSAPRDDDGKPTVWDNDAVQLCGQALLMEEAFGAPVERGFQFYAGTRERVEVPVHRRAAGEDARGHRRVPAAVGPGRPAGPAAGGAAAPLFRLLAGPGLSAGGDALPDRPAARRRRRRPRRRPA